MKAIILNSGRGSRLGDYTKNKPKCMVLLRDHETIISYQLKIMEEVGVKDIVVSTGYMSDVLEKFIKELDTRINISLVYNPQFATSNYITSLNCVEDFEEDVLLFHGDLVFSKDVLRVILENKRSMMVVDSTLPLPEKDFKAVIVEGKIKSVGIQYMAENCLAAQPLYYLRKEDWLRWKKEIRSFCEMGLINVYAENALNKITEQIELLPFDIKGALCSEIDTEEDLLKIRKRMERTEYE